MGLKEDYQEKLEAQLKEWSARISDFKAKADKAAADVRAKYQEEAEALRQKCEAAQTKLKELKEAGEGVWGDLKTSIERAWNELREGVERAATRLGPKADGGETGEREKEEEIRRIAHKIWEEEGRPDGRASEHWSRAEALWEEQHSQKPSGAQPEAAAQPPASRKKGGGRKQPGGKPKRK